MQLSTGTAITVVAGVATVGADRTRAVGTLIADPAAVGRFLDPGIVHEIAVTLDPGAYDAMIQAYVVGGDKEWIEASVAIDGATYPRAGMRLKGNSSLMGLRLGQGDVMGPGNPGGAVGEQGDAPDILVGGPGNDMSADTPERLPWLIRLDKYVDGQAHEGVTELVIRSNGSETSLNEAVALDLLAEAGLASQAAAATAFHVNGGPPKLRLAIEHPNDAWMAAHFSADGLLYKSEATGDWSYRGDSPRTTTRCSSSRRAARATTRRTSRR
jgi:spore coat protein CotH